MMRTIAGILVALALMGSQAGAATGRTASDLEQAANKEIVAIAGLVRQAEEIDPKAWSADANAKGLQLLIEAKERLKTMQKDYPGTFIAATLAAGGSFWELSEARLDSRIERLAPVVCLKKPTAACLSHLFTNSIRKITDLEERDAVLKDFKELLRQYEVKRFNPKEDCETLRMMVGRGSCAGETNRDFSYVQRKSALFGYMKRSYPFDLLAPSLGKIFLTQPIREANLIEDEQERAKAVHSLVLKLKLYGDSFLLGLKYSGDLSVPDLKHSGVQKRELRSYEDIAEAARRHAALSDGELLREILKVPQADLQAQLFMLAFADGLAQASLIGPVADGPGV